MHKNLRKYYIISQILKNQRDYYIIDIYHMQRIIFKLLFFNKFNVKYYMIVIIYNLGYLFHLQLNIINFSLKYNEND
jgi:hypothetical protein